MSHLTFSSFPVYTCFLGIHPTSFRKTIKFDMLLIDFCVFKKHDLLSMVWAGTQIFGTGTGCLQSGPVRVWNDLSEEIRLAETVTSFKSILWTFFYQRAFPDFTFFKIKYFYDFAVLFCYLCVALLLWFTCMVASYWQITQSQPKQQLWTLSHMWALLCWTNVARTHICTNI